MSEPIPESVPTSADPRSHRPIKKARPNPSANPLANEVTSLFSDPDREVVLPPTSAELAARSAAIAASQVPEIMQNVQGSSAGAGSGEFHVYKASRRREYDRVRQMEAEVEKEKLDDEWEKKQEERKKEDEEKRAKNKAKRDKKKNKQQKGTTKDASKANGDGGLKNQAIAKGVAGGLARAALLSTEGSAEGSSTTADKGEVSAPPSEEIRVIIHEDD